jgi:hypothetical protein
MPLEKETMIFSSIDWCFISNCSGGNAISLHTIIAEDEPLLDTVLTDPIRKHRKPKALLSDLTDDIAEEILMVEKDSW